MNRLAKYAILGLALASSIYTAVSTAKTSAYEPSAIFCYGGNDKSALCPTIPNQLGPDQALNRTVGYNSIYTPQDSQATDVQSPFDNQSWQTFVAVNWAAGSAKAKAPGPGGNGPRVWQTWPTVASVFHNAPVLAHCLLPLGTPLIQIGATTDGKPDGHNEEYIQAATDDPLIDVLGNWTIYERRINNVEVAFLQAPDGDRTHNLTTLQGQAAFVKAHGGGPSAIDFPYGPADNSSPGAMEIKAAWRILDPTKHAANAKRFFIMKAMLTVPAKLVMQPKGKTDVQICAPVELGLVAMHIIQKNQRRGALPDRWFWATFEHVDNAPLATKPCDPAQPNSCAMLTPAANDDCPATAEKGHSYSYFDPDFPGKTNQAPPKVGTGPYLWNPVQPYAASYMTPGKKHGFGTQVSRCWAPYPYTAHLNALWRQKLRDAGSVFANYMLVGSQWGAGANSIAAPTNATLGYLSNTLIETYIQTQDVDGKPYGAAGSCVSCHAFATLPNQKPNVCNVASNFSFVPSEATALLLRSIKLGAQQNCGTTQMRSP